MRKVAVVLTLALAVAFAAFWFVTAPEQAGATVSEGAPDLDNGRTVFFAGGCASCHATPDQPDRTLLGGGHALASPVGNFVAPNISPDLQHGIGAWTQEQFASALLKGVSPRGRHYYPAFPYTAYQHMKSEDVRDLFAFIQTLPATGQTNPGHDFPLDLAIVRRGMGLWKLINFRGEPYDDPAADPQLVRGRYLVEALGHCGECHSPRDITGAVAEDRLYAGGKLPDGDSVPNITPGKGGIGEWTQEDLVFFFEDGTTPEGDVTGGEMASVIANTSQLPEADRQAMAAYLKSLPAREAP